MVSSGKGFHGEGLVRLVRQNRGGGTVSPTAVLTMRNGLS